MSKEFLYSELRERLAEDSADDAWDGLSEEAQEEYDRSREAAWNEKVKELMDRAKVAKLSAGASESDAEVVLASLELPESFGGFDRIDAILNTSYDYDTVEAQGYQLHWFAYNGVKGSEGEEFKRLWFGGVGVYGPRFTNGSEYRPEFDEAWDRILKFERSLTIVESELFLERTDGKHFLEAQEELGNIPDLSGYVGEWVAVRHGLIIAHDADPSRLREHPDVLPGDTFVVGKEPGIQL